MMNQTKEFDRVYSLALKSSYYLQYKYGVDYELALEKALDIWAESKETIELILQDTTLSSEQIEKKIYFMFKDKSRVLCGIYQKVKDGKRIWYSPYLNIDLYDTTEEDYIGMEELDDGVQKDIYYEHKKHFNLTDNEYIFIDLCFAGYNPYNEIDVLLFREVLDTESNAYIKTYFNRLCVKLKNKARELGLR